MHASVAAARPAPILTSVERTIVETASLENVRGTIDQLIAGGPRAASSDAYRAAAELMVGTLASYGWDARIESVSRSALHEAKHGAATLYNVVADRKGTAPDAQRQLVIAGAHLDTVPEGVGANDNSSGAATLLEAARVLGSVPMANDVRLLWFDGEEQGLLGSRARVNSGSDELARTKVMLNADMLASKEQPGFDPGTNTPQADIDRMHAIGRKAGIELEQRGPSGSGDHFSYDQAKVPSFYLGVSEQGAYSDPNYHQPSDTVANMDTVALGQWTKLLPLSIYDYAGAGTAH
ncbi:MAG: putative aminopeptidase [Thermoleophilia bacterium]|nr:putative aminopeptidase [Thermoleophilia bacterium]